MSQSFEQFGKYILLERLAAGGMAEVYLSKLTAAEGVNKFVAIKRILPQFSDNSEFIDMFKEEAKIAINLKQGNVVSIYDFGVEKGQFFLVMEYVEGKNLRQILNELKKNSSQFTIEQIVYLIKEVAAGLDHAHRCIEGATGKPLNIVHRDMSPQNIMVSFDGEVKIIDFGIAKATTQLEATRAGTLKGKYGYMSPEQAEGESIDHRTDIFSLGIVMWELLANDRLFIASSEAAILRKIRECQIPSIKKINPAVPPELEIIVNKTLAKDKNLRYNSAAALFRDLNRFLNTQYPDFSAQDFSVFVKNSFSASYLELRKKLIDYSKQQHLPPTPKLKNTGDETVINTPPQRPPPPTDLVDEEFEFEVDQNNPVNLEGIQAPPKPIPTGTINKRVLPSNNTNINQHSGMFQRTSVSKKQEKSVVGLVMTLTFVFAIIGFGYYAYENIDYTNLKREFPFQNNSPTITKNPPTPPMTQEIHKTEMATQAPDYIVTFYSSPDKARIFINDVDTGEITPSQLKVKANTPIKVSYIKEGYQVFQSTYTPSTTPSSFQGSLKQLGKVAYIILNLFNAGASPELFIDGVEVKIKPPSEGYAIAADHPVKIRIENKITGLKAESTISVPADQRKILDLYLK